MSTEPFGIFPTFTAAMKTPSAPLSMFARPAGNAEIFVARFVQFQIVRLAEIRCPFNLSPVRIPFGLL
jgi:hypothetical protein